MKQKIWITGASSFVGAALAGYWRKKGHEVLGLHSRPIHAYEGIQRKRLDSLVSKKVRLEELDVRNPVALKKSIQEFSPTVAVYHAGWVDRYAGWDYDFDRGYAVNVAPLGILVETLRDVGARGLLATGSAAEYPDGDGAHKESTKGIPSTPYGLSKLMETVRLEQLAHHHNVRIRVVKLFIPFGLGDTPSKVIPSVVGRLMKGEPVNLSPCLQRRDFLYVDDLLDGYDRLLLNLEEEARFEVYNLCGGKAICLRQVLEKLADHLGAERNLLRFGAIPLRAGEPKICYGSRRKAFQKLGWTPRPWLEGIKAYAESVLKGVQP